MSLFPPDFLKSVLIIKTNKGTATVFIYSVKVGEVISEGNNQSVIFLVTNRHVVEGINYAEVVFNTKNDELKKIGIEQNSNWIFPKEKEVDLAMLPVDADFFIDNNFDHRRLSEETTITDEAEFVEKIHVGQDIFLAGFPLGIEGVKQNYPILRQGIVARNDSELLSEKLFFLDVNNFPGNSGGPVFTRPSISALEGKTALNQCLLIGVVSAYKPSNNIIYDPNVSPPKPILFKENSGIALAVPIFIAYQIAKEFINEWVRKRDTKVNPQNLKKKRLKKK